MSAIDRLLEGAVDLHFHSHPSPFPRAMDAAAAAEKYDAAGFRAVVEPTCSCGFFMPFLVTR